MSITNTRAPRRGSTLLLCMLAATVLGMASVALLRSSSLQIAKVDAVKSVAIARCASDGLLQRSIASLRIDPNLSGSIRDVQNGLPGSRAEVTRLTTTATQIRVYLYASSTAPSIEVVVDPTTL